MVGATGVLEESAAQIFGAGRRLVHRALDGQKEDRALVDRFVPDLVV